MLMCELTMKYVNFKLLTTCLFSYRCEYFKDMHYFNRDNILLSRKFSVWKHLQVVRVDAVSPTEITILQ